MNISMMANKGKRRCQTPKRNNRAKRQRQANDNEVACATKILDVNNDCLEHVFNHLSLMELIDVAGANKQLGTATASVFFRKYGRKTVEILAGDFSSSLPESEAVEVTDNAILIRKRAQAFRILRLFGECISNITLKGKWPNGLNLDQRKTLNKPIFVYINEYCSDSLNSLTLDHLIFAYEDTKKPYKNVEKISVQYGTIEFEASQFNDTFPKLHRLDLNLSIFFEHKRGWFGGRFQQLEHFKIAFPNFRDGPIRTDVREIIRLNPQLQSLSVSADFNLKFWDYAGKQLKQLTALELSYDQDDFEKYPADPIRFESVETLKLNVIPSINKWGIEKVFMFKQLKQCTFSGDCYLDDSWIDFAIMHPTIEKLAIVMLHSIFLSEHQMTQLAINLPNLTELDMDQCSCSVNAAIRFLKEKQTIRKFSLRVYNEDYLDKLYSRITPEWNATKKYKKIVIERKE